VLFFIDGHRLKNGRRVNPVAPADLLGEEVVTIAGFAFDQNGEVKGIHEIEGGEVDFDGHEVSCSSRLNVHCSNGLDGFI
jgi:hypothetical protein